MIKIGHGEGDNTDSTESGRAADEGSVLLGMNTAIIKCSGNSRVIYIMVVEIG